MAKTRSQRRKEASIPDRFVPRFWADVDGRLSLKKEIQRRLDELIEHTGADSAQKQMLCEAAVFINLQLETMKTTVVESGKLDIGAYVQGVNALSGLLAKLGLEKKKPHPATNLRAYVKARA